MLMVQHTQADYSTPLYKMPSMEEKKKEVDQKASKIGHHLRS